MPFNSKDYEKYELYIISEIEEGYIHVQFNNPKLLNSFNEHRWKHYQELLEQLDQDPDTVLILISLNVPKAFSSGLDLKDALQTMGASATADDAERYRLLHKHIVEFQYAIATPSRIDTPTICVLNGISYGLAIDIASACSIRVATDDVKLLIREIKIGIPADIGLLQRMSALVNNQSLLYERALTGSVFLARDALDWGFVSRTFPTLKAAVEYCVELGSDISGHQRWALRGTKRSINDILLGTTVEQGLKNVADLNARSIDGKFLNAMKGVFKGKL